MNILSLQSRPRFIPHIKEEPCTRCLQRGNSSGTFVGPRKVPAAGGDSAVGGAEREGSEVTAREREKNALPVTPELSAPSRGGGGAPEPYFGTALPSGDAGRKRWKSWRCSWSHLDLGDPTESGGEILQGQG